MTRGQKVEKIFMKELTKRPYCGNKKGMINKFTITGEDYYDFQGNFLGQAFINITNV